MIKLKIEVKLKAPILFQIGRMVFKGFKKLNRIQSIVFDMAYNTNENLLVAAPTGAGKTNIALLTIVHEVKNNIKDGVLKKDDFKVRYFVWFALFGSV